MIDPIHQFNKAFENRIRLGIMSILMVNERVDFNYLKNELGLTDGNLASHVKALEQVGYIAVEKQFVNRKPNTNYLATDDGKKAFKEHLDALELFLRRERG